MIPSLYNRLAGVTQGMDPTLQAIITAVQAAIVANNSAVAKATTTTVQASTTAERPFRARRSGVGRA